MTDKANRDLLAEIYNEINDERFAGLIHGTRNAAGVGGCSGPMCRKYHRDKARAQRERKYGVTARSRTPKIDKIVAEAIAEHAREVMNQRAEKIIEKVS